MTFELVFLRSSMIPSFTPFSSYHHWLLQKSSSQLSGRSLFVSRLQVCRLDRKLRDILYGKIARDTVLQDIGSK